VREPARDAAVLARDAEPFLEVPADRDVEVEVAERAVLEVERDEPADGTEAVEPSGAEARDGAAQEPRGVHQVAAVASR